MITLIEVTLESEMDLVLSNQKFFKVAALLRLSLSTKSTFASAISEVVRIMTDHTDNAVLNVGIKEENRRYKLICKVFYPKYVGRVDEGLFLYAKKLVPFFDTYTIDSTNFVEFSIGLPNSLNLDAFKLNGLSAVLKNAGPISSYEELKNSKKELFEKSEIQEEELRASKFLNDLKSEFISMASHELKTPITILKAYGQLALSGKIKTLEEAQSLVKRMDVQITKLSLLALQLLDTAKIENGKLEYEMVNIDLNPYLIKVIEDLSHLVPNHRIITELGETRNLNFDKLRIEQVLSNLLSNAAKYSEQGTDIYIRTFIESGHNMMTLAVSDTGIGISEEGLSKIFDKFHREPEVLKKQSGLGMGMYIASKIINAHDGKIWAESKHGAGSTFYISLPIVKY